MSKTCQPAHILNAHSSYIKCFSLQYRLLSLYGNTYGSTLSSQRVFIDCGLRVIVHVCIHYSTARVLIHKVFPYST